MHYITKNESSYKWRLKLHEIIFEADTPTGKTFDVLIILCIVISVIIVMLDSISSIHTKYYYLITFIEWSFTILFTIEYILRLISVGSSIGYAISFYGIIDFLAIIPTYLSLLLPGSQYLIVIRILRILRIFRIFKLVQYVDEAKLLMQALKASRKKITVFLFVILTLVVIFGSFMYVIEGEENGFTSIPRSIYWAIVTLTTVGYGDISPKTNLGQTIAALIMIFGYSIIAVPTGIVTAQLSKDMKSTPLSTQVCPKCYNEDHAIDAVFCKYCGAKL